MMTSRKTFFFAQNRQLPQFCTSWANINCLPTLQCQMFYSFHEHIFEWSSGTYLWNGEKRRETKALKLSYGIIVQIVEIFWMWQWCGVVVWWLQKCRPQSDGRSMAFVIVALTTSTVNHCISGYQNAVGMFGSAVPDRPFLPVTTHAMRIGTTNSMRCLKWEDAKRRNLEIFVFFSSIRQNAFHINRHAHVHKHTYTLASTSSCVWVLRCKYEVYLHPIWWCVYYCVSTSPRKCRTKALDFHIRVCSVRVHPIVPPSPAVRIILTTLRCYQLRRNGKMFLAKCSMLSIMFRGLGLCYAMWC